MEERVPPQVTPEEDPIVSRSYALHYFIACVILLATLFWAFYDEFWGMRPWKAYQNTFAERYLAYLGTARSQSAESEAEIKNGAGYQELDQAYQQAMAAAEPRLKELQARVSDLSAKIDSIQTVFTDRRAWVNAKIYQIETSESESEKAKLRKQLEEGQKETREVHIAGEGAQQLNFLELETRYNDLKAERVATNGEIAALLEPVNQARVKRDQYLAERMVALSPGQIDGVRAEIASWSPRIVQINVGDAHIVDRCESCHLGVLQSRTNRIHLTPAAMTTGGGEPDLYARAFAGHPRMELLEQHDPESFGCSPCHGGNGRATSSVVKGHGRHKYWLWPMWQKENMEAGCQQCHGADMFLPGADLINEGKELFMVRGCMGCHRYEGYDREPELLQAIRQQIQQLETQKKENLRQAGILGRQGDQAETNEQANRLYRQAEALRVSVSGIDGRIEQLDLQSKGLLRDVKKIGPNLKEVRAKLNKNWIPEWIRKPTDFRPTTKMPNFRLNEQQVKSISAYLWQASLTERVPPQPAGDATRGKELFETRGCMACHSMGEGGQMEGGDFAANLSRLGEKANYDYIVRWVHNPRQRLRPYCPHEKKDIGPEDYARKGLPYVFDYENSTCPNDGHQLQVQQMTVMPNLRLTDQEARDIASYLISRKQKEPTEYADASYMDDPKLKAEGAKWIRHYGCAGCHEISGFEDEGRIGTELTEEGSKPLERLDFALLTHPAERGVDPFTGEKAEPWYNHKGFFQNKLRQPNIYDKDKVRDEMEVLRMPDPHLNPEQIRALTTFLLGSQKLPLPEEYTYKPQDQRKAVQEGWWLVKRYNCMGCHQFVPGQATSLMQMARYQDPDWKEQLPPQLLTQGARVDPNWLMRFLRNPALSETDLHRNGVRPYLRARMPTFNFSDNELRTLVRFFVAMAQQSEPYIPQKLATLTPRETEMARALFTSVAAPCLKCHATGDPAHDRTATAPNFLLVKERLKPGWTERWMIDPQAISPGTSMPSNLFRRENGRWVFNGPVPPSFQGYDKDHTELLVRYMFQLTPEEQRRAAGRSSAAAPRPSQERRAQSGADAAGGPSR